MSFHLNRLSNKLFKTKLPTSTYQSHYSFKHKRSAQDETHVPQVQVDPDANTPLPTFMPNIKYSNWRRMSNLTPYEYPEGGTFWVRLGTMLIIPGYLLHESIIAPDNELVSAHANYTCGAGEYQSTIDMTYEDI